MTTTEPTLTIHTRLPQRLVRKLDVYAAERGIWRQEALAEILEEYFEASVGIASMEMTPELWVEAKAAIERQLWPEGGSHA